MGETEGIGFETAMAKAWNLKMFRHIAAKSYEASLLLAQERGPCPDAADMGAKAFVQIQHDQKVSRDPVMNAAVQRVGRRIVGAAGMTNCEWEWGV